MASKDSIIEPPGKLIRIDWKELWTYRDLFLVLAWRDISVRYKQTALGVLWAILQPVLTMVIFTIVFNGMIHIKSGDGTPYPIFLYIGLLLWQYFAATVNNAAQSMVSNAGLIQKVYFPRILIPVAGAATALIDLAVASVVFGGMLIFYRIVPQLSGIMIIPLLLAIATLFATGIGFFLASLNIKYRDVRYALPFLINIGLYITPVIYPVAMLDRYPVAKTLLIWLNPMATVISSARAGLLGNMPPHWGELSLSLLIAGVYFSLGLVYFRRTEYYFADIA